MRKISYNAITPFHMLLEASLFPDAAIALVQEFPAMEAEETRDALSQRAVTWRQLLWHWAIEQGQVSLLSGIEPSSAEVTFDAEPFYEAIAEVQSIVALEFSVPLRPVGEHGPIDRDSWAGRDRPVMAPFEGQQAHLVERSDWFSIDFTSITDGVELDETELEQLEQTLLDTRRIPIFGEPSLCLGSGQRIGEVWVRITNPFLEELQQDLANTLRTFIILGDGRLELVRDALHHQQTPLTEEQVTHLNAYLWCRSDINRMLRGQVDRISNPPMNHRDQQFVGGQAQPEFPSERQMKDFFISYNKNDKAWAAWIAWTLEEAGYSVIIQAWDFRPGHNFVLEMQRAATGTQRTIAVLSENYLQAEYTQPEWAAAFVRDPQGQQRTLIPVRVGECNPGGILSSMIHVNLVGLAELDARNAIIEALQERAKPVQAPAFPGAERPTAPVPFPGTVRSENRRENPR